MDKKMAEKLILYTLYFILYTVKQTNPLRGEKHTVQLTTTKSPKTKYCKKKHNAQAKGVSEKSSIMAMPAADPIHPQY
jgi:hypothetical protein